MLRIILAGLAGLALSIAVAALVTALMIDVPAPFEMYPDPQALPWLR